MIEVKTQTAKKIPDSCNIRATQICIVPMYLEATNVFEEKSSSIMNSPHTCIRRIQLWALRTNFNQPLYKQPKPSARLTHPNSSKNGQFQFPPKPKGLAHHMNGETRLKTWKLFNLRLTIWSPVNPAMRKTNAASRSESVTNDTTFQKSMARQVANRRSLKI